MANVSANIGANTQQAESSIGRLLASLRKLRQESSTGVGMKMFASDEVNKLSTALNQAIAAAGALNKLDLSQFDQSLRRSAELLKRNADHYLRAQQAMGNQGVAGRFAQQLGAGGNPLNPNFGQMFPGMQGAALKAQMEFYFKSMLRGTGLSGGFAGGGGGARGGDRGGTTGQGGGSGRSEATENEGVFSGAGAGLLAGVGKLLGPLVAAIGVGKLASASLASARGNVEAEDTLMRMTRDTGAAAGKLADEFIAAGLKVGLSATEAMKTAQVFASAAQEIDRGKAMTGATSAAGFARGYGLNINGTTETLGGLQRAGVMGSNEVVQNSFLMKMAQVIKDTGMTANADQVLSDLAQTVDRYISHDSATPDQNKLDAFTSLRAATYMTPGLSGQHGQNLLNRYDENMRSDDNDARNVMMATALQRYGVSDPYAVRAIQAEGANYDLSQVPGWKGPKGMTYGEMAANEAHRIAYGAAGGKTGNPQSDFNRAAMARVVQAQLLGESIPGAEKPWELYQQRQVDRESMIRHQGDLKRYGLGMGDFKGTGGFKDVLDLLETDDQNGIRQIAKRYASELDITDEKQLASQDRLNKFLENPDSDPEAIKKATLQAMAQHGQHGTMATDDRTKDAMVDNALANTGKVYLSEWNKLLMIGAKSLDGLAEVSDDLKETFEELLLPAVRAVSRESMNAASYLKEIYHGESEFSLLRNEGAIDEQGNLLPGATPEQKARQEKMKALQPAAPSDVTPSGPAPAGSPRSWKNNNPGNLRGEFYGATGNSGGFATYANPQAGWDAMEKQLYRYYEGKTTGVPLQTVGDIIKTWAPSSDGNNPGRYAAEVAGSLGVGVNDKFDINDDDFRHRLMGKIAGYEAGRITPYGSNLGRSDTPNAPSVALGPSRPAKPADTGSKAPAAPSVDTTGLNIEDQSDPNFGYGESATANKQPFKGIIFHHTSSDSLQNEVNYGKTKDAKRGGAFGYHYYIDRDGKVVQGAPLDKRTNHIKPGSKSGLSNKDAMGISLVGAKDGATPEQLAAAQKLGTSVMASNNIDPKNIYGHGELQKDRMAHEGVAAADQLRKAKPNVPADTGATQKGIDNPDDTFRKDLAGPRRDTGALQPGADPDIPIGATTEADRDKLRAERDAILKANQAPGAEPVDAAAKQTIGAAQTKNFGELQVNVNNYQNGVKQSTNSQTLRAGSGGADNSVKGAVNISPEAVA